MTLQKGQKKLQFYVSINPFLHVAMAQLVSRFFLTRQRVGKQNGAARVLPSDFTKLLTAGNLFRSGPNPERALEPTQVHEPIRSSGR